MGLKTTTRRLSYDTRVLNYFNQVTTYTSDIITEIRHRNGTDDPKFEDRIRKGENAANAMYAYKQKVTWNYGIVHFRRKFISPGTGYSTKMRSPSVIQPGIDPNLLSDAKNKAAIGIRKKIGEQTTTVSGQVILGEIRKTVHMIRHPAEAITQLLHKFVEDHESGLRRARRQRIANLKLKSKGKKQVPGYTFKNGVPRATADTIAKSYLELVFGLQPLMSDIAAIAEAALSKYEHPRILRLSFTAQAQSATSTVEDYNPPGSVVWCPANTDYTDEVSVRYNVGYRITTQGVSEGWKKVLAQSGFNLAEIVPSAWNLLPWSFFLDYVGNIGDVLAANAVSLENVAWAYMTIRRNARKTVSIQCSKCRLQPDAMFYWEGAWGSDYLSTSTIVEVKREAASIPYGELRFELPAKNRQFVNTAALLWLQLSK